MHFSTSIIHACSDNPLGAVSPPLFLSSAFKNAVQNGYSYSRCSNPTREALEKTVAAAENGKYGFAFSSGLAAEDSLFSQFSKIICGKQVYGGTKRLLSSLNKQVVFADMCDKNTVESLKIDGETLVFAETPSNPLSDICDIRLLAEITHSQGGLLAIDNTFLSPYFQNPLLLGADAAVHSATKYLCGHHDAVSGCVVTNSDRVAEGLGFAMRTKGNGLSPFDSFLVRRGMETLCLRMEKHNENSKKVFEFLKSRKNVGKIYYAGDKNSKGYETNLKQARGFGGIISFETKNAVELLPKLKLIGFAESLGGNATLITHPYTQTHGTLGKEERYSLGITPDLLRLSVGTEDAEDIIAELETIT